MKKIPVVYWIFAVLCFFWGCIDLYAQARLEGYIQPRGELNTVQFFLASGSWLLAAGKLLLAPLILVWGRRAAKKKESSCAVPRLLPWLSRRGGLMMLGLWLLTMSLLTIGTAQYVLRDLADTAEGYPEYVNDIGYLGACYPLEEGEEVSHYRQEPGGVDYCMLTSVSRMTTYIHAPYQDAYPDKAYNATFQNGIYYGHSHLLNTAVLFLDGEGKVLHQSGNYFYFGYTSAESWAAGEDTYDGYGWIDLNGEVDEHLAFMRSENNGLHPLFWAVTRMTGYFDGSRFTPLSVAVADSYPLEDQQTAEERVNTRKWVQWDVRFDLTDQAPAGKELVTIYVRRPYTTHYDEKTVRYRGETYDDLTVLMQEVAKSHSEDMGNYTFRYNNSQYNLFNSVFFGIRDYRDMSGYDYRSGQNPPDPEITMVTAIQARPLLIAMKYLVVVYIFTAVLALAAFFWLRSLWKDHVSLPLQVVNDSIAEGWGHLPAYQYTPPALAELQKLVEHYHSTQQRLYNSKNEIARLNTAITYAKTAEENRRQMTSHIAHELKTPLAVIHSYTEGLQERIAEEKREKYLEVILSETERMDAMVLEMLDLSRLEAGRVKLAQDEFSLLALTRSVFDKLDLAVQAQELQVSYECYYDAMVTADESRIRQVVENFATNAVKHTPAGGEIRIHIYTDHKGTVFSMENDGENLPDEVLDKVWDSFWRQDESRSSPGTGLGLAIAKGIITLHGGECAAHNTKRGVEFRFRI